MKSQKLSSVSTESQITCVKIGPKSGRVMVTGSLDRHVNLYAIGKPSSLITLQGHVTPIASVSMDWSEQLVVAGSNGGNLKLWDLDNQNIIRTLAGHRDSVISLEFHPFGEFFASGSLDLSLKIWDIRRKGCIQTYHGHDNFISDIKISPDGRWVCSASKDSVKIWDLTAGKLLKTLDTGESDHQTIAFNPSEFVLAATNGKGNLSIFDLNTFEVISSISAPVDKAVFNPAGNRLLVSTADKFQNFAWDPVELEDEIASPWKKSIQDIKVLPENDGIVVCAITGNFVDIWAIGALNGIQKASNDIDYPVLEQNVDIEDVQGMNLNNSRNDEDIISLTKKTAEASINQKFKYIPLADGNQVLNLDLSTFIKSKDKTKKSILLTPEHDLEIFDSLKFGHSSVQTILNDRLQKIHLLKDNWDNESIAKTISLLPVINQSIVTVDLLKIINLRPKMVTLDTAIILVSLCSELFFEPYEDFIMVGLKTLEMVYKSFKQLIVTTLNVQDQLGLNINFEDRLEKCKKLKSEFGNAICVLNELALGGKVGKLMNDVLKGIVF